MDFPISDLMTPTTPAPDNRPGPATMAPGSEPAMPTPLVDGDGEPPDDGPDIVYYGLEARVETTLLTEDLGALIDVYEGRIVLHEDGYDAGAGYNQKSWTGG